MAARCLVQGLVLTLSFHGTYSQCWPNTPCTGLQNTPFPGPWEANILSPANRTVTPMTVLDMNHKVISPWRGSVRLQGNNAGLILDFGLEVGGVVTISYTSCGSGTLGLAFSESRTFTGFNSDESNGGTGPDGALLVPIRSVSCGAAGSYTMPLAQQRGGFRYLTLYTMTDTASIDVNITSVTLNLTFQPSWPNLRAYGGFFDSSDSLLNKIWYACTYTIQLNTIRADSGRAYPLLNTGWNNAASVGTTVSPVLVDGAKRDRAIWAGDLGIAVRSALIGTGDRDTIRTSIQVQYDYQQNSGELPMVGPPISFYGSDTYHMSTLLGTYDYIIFTDDMGFLNSIWDKFVSAMNFVIRKIDGTGMMAVTGANNWGRTAPSNGYATDANMMVYGCLVAGASLAGWKGDSALQATWTSQAALLKSAINRNNWDDVKGAYKNTASDGSIYPEDGNSMALYYNGFSSAAAANRVSSYLKSNWGAFGAVTPELPGNVVPYIESFEIKGHLVSGNTQRALDLMRLSWGWYLNNPEGTGSSMIEGYYTDGTFQYRDSNYNKGGAYTSHAHGWSTGPTDALVSFVVGLRPTSPGGMNWVLAPQFGDLKYAKGGFFNPLGPFSASWQLINDTSYQISVNTPSQTSGEITMPPLPNGKQVTTVTVDNEPALKMAPSAGISKRGQMSMKIGGGNHKLTATT